MTNLYRSGLCRFGGLLAAVLVSTSVYAGDIHVENAWVRATAPGQDAAGVDLTITSKQAASLLGVSSPVAETTELHSMTSENGMMKMREVKSIALPAGKRMNLRESGYHLMLNGLKSPLKEGETVLLTLSIKVAKRAAVNIEVRAEVRSLHATRAAEQEDPHRSH